MNIPEKLMDLEYSKHAIRERIFEQKGCIEHVPQHFIRTGCKRTEPGDNGTFKAVYIYDDVRDIVLVISPVFNRVVTNYLVYANNRNVYKGRFRLNITTKRGKLKATF